MSLNAVSSFILNQNQFILSIYLFLFGLVWFEFSFFRFFFSTISGGLTWPGQGSRINSSSRRKNLLTFPSKTKTTLQPFSTTIFALYKMLKCWKVNNVKKLKMLKSWKCWKVDNYEECRFVIICSKYPERCWWFSSHFKVECWNLRKFLVQFLQFYDLVFKLRCSR